LLACRPVLTHLPENIILAHKESENDKFLHMHAPFKSHFHIALRLLKYLKLAPRNVTRRSISGYWVFVNGCLVSWKIKNQATLSKSSTKVEYRSMEAATCEVMWIVKITRDLNVDNLLIAELYL
ncbi:ribonuclease H-like domain-containing protein, partial [Tanacetum coccineum]